MKKNLSLLLFLGCSLLGYGQGILLHGNKTYAVDTLSYSHMVGPGTNYASYRLPEYPMAIYVMEVDLNNPYIKLEGCMGQDKAFGLEQPTRVAARHNAPGHEVVGVTNGDFYFYLSDDYLSYGIARSGQFINNECVTNPVGRACFVLDDYNKPHIDNLDFNGTITKGSDTRRLHSLNMLRLEWESDQVNANMLTLYTNAFSAKTTNVAGGSYAVIRSKSGAFFFSVNKDIPCVVESIAAYEGPTTIPNGKALLHGRGTSSDYLNSLTVGDELTIRLNTNLRREPGLITDFKQTMGGSNHIILRDGELFLTPEQGTSSGVHPRTGMGFSKDSTKVYLIVVDGRQGHSPGVQLDDFGAIFRYFGAWNAVNLDGGGSSVMGVNGSIMNKPSGGVERAVGNGMLIISQAPADDDIAWLEFHDGPFNLPTYASFTPIVLGFNQYGVLKMSRLTGYTLTCTPNLGHIENDTVLVVGGEGCTGTLTATYNGYSVHKTVRVEQSPMNFRLDSVLLDERPYRMEVEGTVNGQKVPIDPKIFAWHSGDTDICSVTDGIITALANGTTWVYGYHADSDYRDSIQVRVQFPTKRYMSQSDMSDMENFTISKSSTLTNWTVTHDNLPDGWNYGVRLNYTYGTSRAPFIKLERQMPLYSLPDSVSLIINTNGEIGFNNVIFGMRSNHETALRSLETGVLAPVEGDLRISYGVEDITDTPTDKIAYPLWVHYISFYITPSTQTSGKSYSLAIKELQLCYDRLVVGLTNLSLADRLLVYPNPVTDGVAHVALALDKPTDIRMEVVNLEGRVLMNKSLGVQFGEVTLPLQGLSQGTYFVRLHQEDKTDLVKIMIK